MFEGLRQGFSIEVGSFDRVSDSFVAKCSSSSAGNALPWGGGRRSVFCANASRSSQIMTPFVPLAFFCTEVECEIGLAISQIVQAIKASREGPGAGR